MVSDRLVLDSVVRVAGRCAVSVHEELKRGVNGLATVAAIAPLLGLLITVEGIVSSFVGRGGEKWACLAAVVERLSNAVARGALGLLVGIVSSWCYRHLMSRLDDFAMEMKCMTLELADILTTFPRQR
jgi:biopolymer transport protein ExbB/TolQ